MARKDRNPAQTDDPALDLANRELCPDGACIGVIGPSGRCNECGKPGKRPAAAASPTPAAAPAPAAEPDEAAEAEAEPPEAVPAAAEEPSGDPEWDKRQLCPDGACIGVIGANGRCTECGKRP